MGRFQLVLFVDALELSAKWRTIVIEIDILELELLS